MDKKTLAGQLIDAFGPAAGLFSVDSMEVLFLEEGTPVSLGVRVYREKFTPVPYEKLAKDLDTADAAGGDNVEQTLSLGNGTALYCLLRPVRHGNETIGLLLLESGSPADRDREALSTAISAVMSVMYDCFERTSKAAAGEHRYKEGLMDLRNVQAKLFPRFGDIPGMDIAAIYLPVELMTGNFIDAFYVDDALYQVAACDISRYNATSSFAGASIRTLVRSLSAKNTVPSALIEQIVGRVGKIVSGIQGFMSLTVYSINVRSGLVTLSSYGDVATLLYSSRKKNVVNLGKTDIGSELSKRIVYKDMHLKLDAGDVLLYHSSGVTAVLTEDKKKSYELGRLVQGLAAAKDLGSREIAHALADSMYEFANYSQFLKDIALVCMKKKVG